MKTITIFLFSLLLNACGSSQVATTSLNEKVKTQSKLVQENFKIEYATSSRGSFSKIILENKTISVQKRRGGEAIVSACTDKDWEAILAMVSSLDVKNMSALGAPSKAHEYDGAALAKFTVFNNGETYAVPSFDAGNPNKEIEALVNKVINIANPTK